jgi:SulP family sulfate permease
VLLAVLLGLGQYAAHIPLACLAGILIVDLIVAVIVGIALASVLFVKKLSDMRLSEHGPLPDASLPAGCPESLKGTVYVYTFKGPLNFGEAKNFGEVMFHLGGIRHVVLVFDFVPLIDQTGAFTVEDTIEQLQRKGVTVLLVHPDPQLRESLERIASRPAVVRDICRDTLEAALETICASEKGEPPAKAEENTATDDTDQDRIRTEDRGQKSENRE